MASTEFTTTTHYVVPTRNDVAPTGYEGYGRVLQELTFVPLLNTLGGGGSHVLDGFELPSTGAGITSKSLGSGEAVIQGYRVATHSTAFSIDLYDDSTNYVYLRVLKNLSKVTEVVCHVADDSTVPSNSLFLGTLVTSSGSITGSNDYRPTCFRQMGTYVGDGAASQSVTVPALGTEKCSLHLVGAYGVSGVLYVYARIPEEGEVSFAFSSGTLDNHSAGTYFEAGGIKTDLNSNGVRYFYWILA